MPTKKRFNARFPPARIKKIMQTDEDIGKVAATVPVIISRALELFLESFLARTSEVASSRNAKTLSRSHIKYVVSNEGNFDFLKDLVNDVPDLGKDDDEAAENPNPPSRRGRPRKNSPKNSRQKSRESSYDNASGSAAEADSSDSEEEESDSETDVDDAEPLDVRNFVARGDDIEPNTAKGVSKQVLAVALDTLVDRSTMPSVSVGLCSTKTTAQQSDNIDDDYDS